MKNLIFISTLIFSFGVFSQSTVELDEWMDIWHYSASKADFHGYFDKMDSDFIFLGTAPGERWTKVEFAAFSKPYFDKGKAWDFKATNRNWSFSENGKIAWFDEDLETWMRGCRGSGVLVKKKGQWRLKQYNLTVLIENEKMDEFIQLRYQPIESEK